MNPKCDGIFVFRLIVYLAMFNLACLYCTNMFLHLNVTHIHNSTFLAKTAVSVKKFPLQHLS